MTDVFRIVFLAIFLLSAPVAIYCVFVQGFDRELCAIINSYTFSSAMVALYIYPFIFPIFSKKTSFFNRLNKATMNWIIWLSVFTEVTFQIPHNLLVQQLHELKGSSFEWPFYAYGFSDSRWNNYNGGVGLDASVWLINVNDAALGFLVLLALLNYWKSMKSSVASPSASIIFVLTVVFRDATLWRETVEYLWDLHRKSYPFCTFIPQYRQHAIICLWLVNIIWLIAPMMSLIWGYLLISRLIHREQNGKKEL